MDHAKNTTMCYLFTSAILLFTACAIPLIRTMEESSLPELLTCASDEVTTSDLFNPHWTYQYMTGMRVCVEFRKPVFPCGEQRFTAWFVVTLSHAFSSRKFQYPPVDYKDPAVASDVNMYRQICRVFDLGRITDELRKMHVNPPEVRILVKGQAGPGQGFNKSTTTFQVSIRSLSYFVDKAEEFPVEEGHHKLHQMFCQIPGCQISADVEEGVKKTIHRCTIKYNETPFCIPGDGPMTSDMSKIFSFQCITACPTKFNATTSPTKFNATTSSTRTPVTFFTFKGVVVTSSDVFPLLTLACLVATASWAASAF